MDNDSYMAARAVSSVSMPDEGVAGPEQAGAGLGPPKHDDVLGEEVPPLLREQVLTTVHLALGIPPSPEFPGSQPVSLARSNANLLLELSYMVSWKADGTRYLMLLMHGGVYLIDRAARVRRCQLRLPAPDHAPADGTAAPAAPPIQCVHSIVVLDGEMVVNAEKPGGVPVNRCFLVYDCCTLPSLSKATGVPPAGSKYFQRWEAIEAAIIRPKELYEKKMGPKYVGAAEPFRLLRKNFYGVEKAEWLLKEFKSLHPCDGLIFQPQDEPYRPRTCERLLKWKNPHLNSVDFFVYEDAWGTLQLYVTSATDGKPKLLSEVALPTAMLNELQTNNRPSPLTAPLYTDRAEEGEPKLVSGMIAECVWDSDRKGWSLLRVRLDKAHPNHESVFVRVWQSICDNLEADNVLELLAPAVTTRKAKLAAAAQKVAGKRKRDDE